MFSVDYATLRQVIRQFVYTGVFRATVTDTRLFLEEGQIELQVKDGVAIACRFVTKQGDVYLMERWEVQIGQLGVLNWELTTSSEEMSPQRVSSSSGSLPLVRQSSTAGRQQAITPHQAIRLLPAQIRQLPLLHRQVYSLVDGRRQPSDIAQLLYKQTQEIAQVIDELRRRGLIEFK